MKVLLAQDWSVVWASPEMDDKMGQAPPSLVDALVAF